MTVNTDEFKQALQLWASGVTVVTTCSESHGRLGMTATSFSSVSLQPPQVLVCINNSALTAASIAESKYFAVNILSSDQKSVSNIFAGIGAGEQDRFASVAWREGANGLPLLDESIASLQCKVINQVRAGTHWVMIGEVYDVICRSGEPLLYYKTQYRELSGEVL